MSVLRRYGFLIIVGVLWFFSVLAYADRDRGNDRDQWEAQCEFAQAAGDPCPTYEYNSSSFWDGMWENIQSENYQLFVQSLLLVALVNILAQKQSENTKQDVREVLREEVFRREDF